MDNVSDQLPQEFQNVQSKKKNSIASSNYFKLTIALFFIFVSIGIYALIKKVDLESARQFTFAPTPFLTKHPLILAATGCEHFRGISFQNPTEWKVYKCDFGPNVFIIAYPPEWEAKGNVLYPYGLRQPQANIVVGASAYKGERAIYEESGYAAGEAYVYWNEDSDFIYGHIDFVINEKPFIFSINDLPNEWSKNYNREIKLIVNKMLKSLRFYEKDRLKSRGFSKRLFNKDGKFYLTENYPRTLLDIPDSDLVSIKCEHYYYIPDERVYVAYLSDNKVGLLEDLKLLELISEASQKLQGKVVDSATFCIAQDGRILAAYEDDKKENAQTYYGFVNPTSRVGQIIIYPGNVINSKCNKVLQLSRYNMLYVSCNASEQAIYRVNLTNLKVNMIFKCSGSYQKEAKTEEPVICENY